MKKFKKLLVVALSVFMIVAACASLTACPPPNNGPSTSLVNVTVAAYDTTKGSVVLDKESYNVGDRVNVNINAVEGYEIKSIYVGTTNMTEIIRQGAYEFTTVEYHFTANVDKEVRVEFQEYGVWKNADYVWSLTVNSYDTTKGAVSITPDRSRYARDEQVTVSVTTTADYIVKSFKVNGVECTLSQGSYTFNITDDTVVAVEFDVDAGVITTGTMANIDSLTSRQGKVLLDFWADDCYYCVTVLAPQLEELVRNYNNGSAREVALDIKVVKVRVSSTYDLRNTSARTPEYAIYERYASRNQSGGLPFVVMLENGNVIGDVEGAYGSYSGFLGWLENPSST